MSNRNMEPAEPSPLEAAITHLASSNQPLLNARLTELTSLNLAEMELLESLWVTIPPERRRQIVRRLVELAEDNLELNFDSIFKYGLKDPDEEVRSQAIKGLWENEEASLIGPLINLLEQDSSEKVQTAAAVALGKFAALAELEKLPAHHIARMRQALLVTFNDKNRPREVRRCVLESAAPLSFPEVKQAIRQAYRSSDSRLRASSVYAMGRSYDSDWLPVLLKELTSADAELRYEAAGACGALEEETAVPGLTSLVNDTDADVRMAAIQALGKIGTRQARDCLKQCLESQNEAVRQAAEQVLNDLESREDPLSFRI